MVTLKFINLAPASTVIIPSFLYNNMVVVYKKDINDRLDTREDYTIKIDNKTVKTTIVEISAEAEAIVIVFTFTKDQINFHQKYIRSINFCDRQNDEIYACNKYDHPYWPTITYNGFTANKK